MMEKSSSPVPSYLPIYLKSATVHPRWARSSLDENDEVEDLDVYDEMEDLESGTVHEMNKPQVPGMWRYPKNPNICCIYRVPNVLRSINPEAYTPRLLLIGPLHRCLISEAFMPFGETANRKSMGYLNTEAHKKIYLMEFVRRVNVKTSIDDMRRVIKEYEDKIRASYSESTTLIQSHEFVEMVLLDSIFIFQFILKTLSRRHQVKTGDPLMDEPCLNSAVKRDLILLENQLPYFILEKLAESTLNWRPKGFRTLIIKYFGFSGKISYNSNFSHFTDLFRWVRVKTLPNHILKKYKTMEHKYIGQMYNAVKLNSGGVEFSLNKEALQKEKVELSLYVKFEKGCLKMPCLTVDDGLETTLRNIMALEQCHDPCSAYVCNYVIFLDHLIDTDKDVDLLVEKGVIKNCIGEHLSVAKMVNKLSLGIIYAGSYYSDIAAKVNAHYTNRFNKARAILKSVYFGNLWTGTATVAAVFLLFMTFIQTVASIIQVMQNVP